MVNWWCDFYIDDCTKITRCHIITGCHTTLYEECMGKVWECWEFPLHPLWLKSNGAVPTRTFFISHLHFLCQQCRGTINASRRHYITCQKWNHTAHHSGNRMLGFISVANLHPQTFSSIAGHAACLTLNTLLIPCMCLCWGICPCLWSTFCFSCLFTSNVIVIIGQPKSWL